MPAIQTPHGTRVIADHTRHRWPIMLHSAFTNVNFAAIDSWLTKPQARQSILTTSFYTAQVLGTRGTWNVIHCPSKLGTLHGIDTTARKVMPAYLQNLCSRRLDVAYNHTNPVLVALDDLARWFKDECGGDPETVQNAHKVLTAAEQEASVDKSVWHRGESDEAQLKKLLEDHNRWTGSKRARELLDNWEVSRAKFVKAFPNEYKRALGEINAKKVAKATAKSAPAATKKEAAPAK